MPLRIRETDIIRRLADRLDLDLISAQAISRLYLSELVIPVTDVGELLKQAKNADVSKDLSGTAGTYTVYHTVPTGKRWTLKWYYRQGSTGTTRVVVHQTVQAQITSNDSTERFGQLEITMDEGHTIGLVTTGDGADTAIGLVIFYDEEDAF
jgi:hypothetical protein